MHLGTMSLLIFFAIGKLPSRSSILYIPSEWLASMTGPLENMWEVWQLPKESKLLQKSAYVKTHTENS